MNFRSNRGAPARLLRKREPDSLSYQGEDWRKAVPEVLQSTLQRIEDFDVKRFP